MKHWMRFLFCLGLLATFALPSHAVLVGPYPGLDKLIQEADVIAVVRVEDAPNMGVDGWTRRSCLVYQTLKGDLPSSNKDNNFRRIPITLNDFVSVKSNIGGESLAPMSSHLVFLRQYKKPVNGANYSILTYRGADMPLSPLGNETKPTGKTLVAQIQTLLRRYKIYRDEQIKHEDETLNKALAE